MGNYTRCVHVPASQEWLAVYNAALLLAANPQFWEQLNPTDVTPDDAASRAMQIYADWLSGECSLDCDDVLACLGPVLADLQRAGTVNPNSVDPSDTTVINYRWPPAERSAAILPPPAGCDNDILWSGVLEIVQRIDQNGRDFWETIVAENDTIQRIGEIVALVPLFGDIIGEGVQLLAEIAPDMLNSYNAYSTPEAIEAVACDLFATTCGECRFPTYQEVYDYFSGRSALGAAAWEDIAFEAAVDVLLGTHTLPTAIVWFTTNILQMWVLAAGATWIRTIGVEYIALWAGIGAASPSDAWELICGPCGGATWSHDFDFTVDQQGWNIRPGQGSWTPQGIAGTQYGTQYILQVNRAWGGPYNITNLSAHFVSTNINNGNFTSGMRNTQDGTPYDFIISEVGVSEEPHDMTFNGDIDRTGPLIFVFGSSFNAQVYLTSIHIEGQGSDPWP